VADLHRDLPFPHVQVAPNRNDKLVPEVGQRLSPDFILGVGQQISASNKYAECDRRRKPVQFNRWK
jgi:hypothetical protein